MWFTEDLARYRSESRGLDALAFESDWLAGGKWRVDAENRLIFEVDIVIGERVFPVFLRFPSTFPDSPPSVFPRDKESRWSNHQFGAGGELCLQYRPDNWTPDLTGVHVMQSAYSLLAQEHPATGEPVVVASAHRQTLGQQLRGSTFRVFLSWQFGKTLLDIPAGSSAVGSAMGCFHEVDLVLFGEALTREGVEAPDLHFPKALADSGARYPLWAIHLPPDATLPDPKQPGFLEACAALGCPAGSRLVILMKGGAVNCYFILEEKVHKAAHILDEAPEARQQDDHQVLPSKSVAIIGCGSLGSKVATMLARAGVGRFVLIDDDIFMPGNLVRNDLDWREVGAHKADAVSQKLKLVYPAATTVVWRAKLGGQESATSADSFLSLVKDCDLIVDATASAENLNVLSGVARAGKKPMVWAEIFGGGIGGMVVRSRPGLDLPPAYARRAIENWFNEKGSMPQRAHRRYETGEEGPPMIADDADVSVIAAHAARYAIDILIDRQPSIFPYSAYAIGLTNRSVFSQPFETHPIDIENTLPPDAIPDLSPEELKNELGTIVKMFIERAV